MIALASPPMMALDLRASPPMMAWGIATDDRVGIATDDRIAADDGPGLDATAHDGLGYRHR